MASIFSLFGEVLIDNTNANKSIDQTTEKAEKSGSKVGSAFSSIAKGTAAVGTAVVAGAAAVGTAAYKMASDTAKQADEVDKMSQKLGMSKTAYQEWDYVLSQAGVEITSMSTGLKTLTNKIDDAKNGSDKASAMFDKLGISVSDLNNMSREEVFNAVIKGMQGMEDSTERAALANDLFGKSGQELTALFNETAESTEKLKNKAHELGMVMSDETIDSGVLFIDTMDTIKRSLGGMLNTLGGAIMPIVQKVLNLIESKLPVIQSIFIKLSPIITSLFDGVLPPLFNLVETLLPVLLNLIVSILPLAEDIISAILPIIVDLLQLLLPPLISIVEKCLPILQALLPVIISVLNLLMPILEPILNLCFTILEPLLDLINIILPPICDFIQMITTKLLPPLTTAFKAVANVVSGVFKGAFDSLKPVFENARAVFNGIIDFIKNVFTGNWRGAWNAVVSIFTNIFNGIKNAVKIPINAVIDGINVFIRGLRKIKIPDWVPGVGGKGINISELKRLRVGMEYVPYDEYPALLHRGERVLTAGENKEYSKAESNATHEGEGKIVVSIQLGERAIYIEHLDGQSEEDMETWVDRLLEIIAEKIRRKELVFA